MKGLLTRIQEILGEDDISVLKTLVAGMEGNLLYSIKGGEIAWMSYDDTERLAKKVQEILSAIDVDIATKELKKLLDDAVAGKIDPRIVSKKRPKIECRIYDYKGKAEQVYQAYINGLTDKESALNKLEEIGSEAYRSIPQAEEDGDITYHCCRIVAKIHLHEKL